MQSRRLQGQPLGASVSKRSWPRGWRQKAKPAKMKGSAKAKPATTKTAVKQPVKKQRGGKAAKGKALPLQDLSDEQKVGRKLKWSFDILESGIHPSADDEGKPWPPNSAEAHLAGKPTQFPW